MDTALSPALAADLEYALGRYGLTAADVPRDHEGMSITQRLRLLDETGQSHRDSTFTKTDLRRDGACVWELFPENPSTLSAQGALVEEVGELLHDEAAFSGPDADTVIAHSMLPTEAHMDALQAFLDYIDGTGEAPVVVSKLWRETALFDDVLAAVPRLREAQETVRVRGLLVAELAAGTLPATTAAFIRKALDSSDEGLRNADITLAAAQVAVANLRDRVMIASVALRPHFEVAERIRQVRDDLDRIDEVLHWPGAWRTAPASPCGLARG